ncbi:MAG: hypothetical protein MI807_03995 [Verrucomicrobiales bacterium]|nr:hypothetical protein [Verrucomicrobiales bacterium]
MSNPKSEFLAALGGFVVSYSKVQNILQEGIYILSAKIHETEDNMVRVFMHDMSINQLEGIFLTLATEYGSTCAHIDDAELKAIRTEISSQLTELKRLRNRMMHSVWDEKFWEGSPGEHDYRMIYHRNKRFRFDLEDVEFDHDKLLDHSRTALSLSEFIHDFLICISDGDTIPEKCFSNYFEFSDKKAVFPRERDIERCRNVYDYI